MLSSNIAWGYIPGFHHPPGVYKLFNAFGIFAASIFKGDDPMILTPAVIGSVHELTQDDIQPDWGLGMIVLISYHKDFKCI